MFFSLLNWEFIEKGREWNIDVRRINVGLNRWFKDFEKVVNVLEFCMIFQSGSGKNILWKVCVSLLKGDVGTKVQVLEFAVWIGV